MANYLVRAKPKAPLQYLRRQLDAGALSWWEPFGGELERCLDDARVDDDGYVVWEEVCLCATPLKNERMILNIYFDELHIESVRRGEGWERIERLPSLWQRQQRNVS
jgi:hypothetical protein